MPLSLCPLVSYIKGKETTGCRHVYILSLFESCLSSFCLVCFHCCPCLSTLYVLENVSVQPVSGYFIFCQCSVELPNRQTDRLTHTHTNLQTDTNSHAYMYMHTHTLTSHSLIGTQTKQQHQQEQIMSNTETKDTHTHKTR